MSKSLGYVQYGPFVPYPSPVVPPETGIFDEPNLCLRVNEDWVPYVTGALKVLRKGETWDTNTSLTRESVERQVDDLLSSWDICSPSQPNTPYHFEAIYPSGYTGTWHSGNGLAGYVNNADYSVSMGFIRNLLPGTGFQVLLHAVNSSSQFVGVMVDDITVQVGSGLSVANLAWTDCFNVLTSETFLAVYSTHDQFGEALEMKDITISTSDDFMSWWIVGHGAIMCEQV